MEINLPLLIFYNFPKFLAKEIELCKNAQNEQRTKSIFRRPSISK